MNESIRIRAQGVDEKPFTKKTTNMYRIFLLRNFKKCLVTFFPLSLLLLTTIFFTKSSVDALFVHFLLFIHGLSVVCTFAMFFLLFIVTYENVDNNFRLCCVIECYVLPTAWVYVCVCMFVHMFFSHSVRQAALGVSSVCIICIFKHW